MTEILVGLKKVYDKVLNALVCRYVGYFDGTIKVFVKSERSRTLILSENGAHSKPILIVSREFYKEWNKQYPLDDFKETKKLIELEFPQENPPKFRMTKGSNGNVNANFWSFKEKVPTSLFLIPESLIFSNYLGDDEVFVKNDNVFVANANSVINSAVKTPLIDSLEKFALSIGGAFKTVKYSTPDSLADFLLRGLVKTPTLEFATFLRKGVSHSISREKMIASLSLPILGLWLFYLVITSAYLQFSDTNLEEQLLEKKESVEHVLDLQIYVDANFQSYERWQRFLASQHYHSEVWLVLPELFQSSEITNFKYENGRYVVSGKTDKATQVLSSLSELEQVVDAKFDFPTRRRRNKDNYVLSFVIETRADSNTLELAAK